MIFYYRNSFLASVVSVFGCALGMAAVYAVLDKDYLYALGFFAAAIPFLMGGKWISENKAFRKWWKQIEEKNLEAQIAAFPETALQVYQKNPQKRTLDAIRKLNPAAADWIAAGAKGPAPVVNGPAGLQGGGTVLVGEQERDPFKTVNLSDGPAVETKEQTAHTEGTEATEVGSSASGILIDVLQALEANVQRRPEVFWDGAQKLEGALKEEPGHNQVRQQLAQCYTQYACNVKEPGFEERKKAVEGLLRALELEKNAQIPVLDNRVLWLYVHALNASADARNREQLSQSLEMLRKAAAYRIQKPNEKTMKMMNVSLPVARCRVSSILAKELAFGKPEDLKKAMELIGEAARICPMDLMRLSDLNPYKEDNAVVLTRQSVLNLQRQIMSKAGGKG